jgi:septum formation protein
VTLILASASPRRQALLREAGYRFEVVVPSVSEELGPDLPPAELAEFLALRKARAGASGRDSGLVLGADTVVWARGEILGKPRDAGDSRRMLGLLSGTVHEVLTGLALVDCGTGWARSAVERTRIRMRALEASEIESYVASGEGIDKAGAYAIQESADCFVTGLDGSWSNVVGLPMELLARMLASEPRR